MIKYNWVNLVDGLKKRYNFNFFNQNVTLSDKSAIFEDLALEVKLDKFAIFNYDIDFNKTLTNTRLIRYTYHQMFRYGLFIGSSVRTSLKTSRWMTMGFRSSFVFINLLTAHAYVRSVMKIVMVAMRRRRSILLSVNRPGSFFVGLIAHLANWCGEAYCGSRWVSGTLSNFKGVWRYFNLYLKKFQFTELSLTQQKLKVALQGLSFLKSKPRMIFFGNYFYGYHGAKEALRTKCAPICVVDSDVFPDHVLYPLPSNDDSYSANEFYIRIIAKSALIGKLYYVMRFYKYKKMSAFNNIVLEKGVHWWDSVSRFFTKKKFSILADQMAKRKKKRYYFLKYLLKFLFLNFFDLILDSKNTNSKLINPRKYFGFFMLYSVYLRVFGERFLMVKNYNVNFFFLFDMFKNLAKALQASDEIFIDLQAKKDYYFIIGNYFKKYFFENFLQNFFKVTPFFYFSFLVKALSNWKFRNFDTKFRRGLITKKWYYWSERISARQRLNKIVVQEWHYVQNTEVYNNFINFNRLSQLMEKVLYDLNLEATNITNYLTFDVFRSGLTGFGKYLETAVLRLYGNPFYKKMYLYYLNSWQSGRTWVSSKSRAGNTYSFFDNSYKKYALFIRFFKQNIFEFTVQYPLHFGLLSQSNINISSGELIEFRRFFHRVFGFRENFEVNSDIIVRPLKHIFDNDLLQFISHKEQNNTLTYVHDSVVHDFYTDYYKSSKQFFGVSLRTKLLQDKLGGTQIMPSKYSLLSKSKQTNVLRSKYRSDILKGSFDDWYSTAFWSWDSSVFKFFNFFYNDYKDSKGFFFLTYLKNIQKRSAMILKANKLTVNNMYETGVTKVKLVAYLKKIFVYIYFRFKNLKCFKLDSQINLVYFNLFVKLVKKIGSFLLILQNLRMLAFKIFFLTYFKAPLQKEFFFFRFFVLNSSLFSKLTLTSAGLNYKALFAQRFALNQHSSASFFKFLSKIRLFKLFISKNLFSPNIKRLYLNTRGFVDYTKQTEFKSGLTNSLLDLNQNLFLNFALIRQVNLRRLIIFRTKLFELFKIGFVLKKIRRHCQLKSMKFANFFKRTNFSYLYLRFKLINFFVFLASVDLVKNLVSQKHKVGGRFGLGKVAYLNRYERFFTTTKGLYWLFLKVQYNKARMFSTRFTAGNASQVMLKIFQYWSTIKKQSWRIQSRGVKQRIALNVFSGLSSLSSVSTQLRSRLYSFFFRTTLFDQEFRKLHFSFKKVNFFFLRQSIWGFFWKLFFNAVKKTFVYNTKLGFRDKKAGVWASLKGYQWKKSSLLFFDSLTYARVAKLRNLDSWILMRAKILDLLTNILVYLRVVFMTGKKKILLKRKKIKSMHFLRKIFYFLKYLRAYKTFVAKLTFESLIRLKWRVARLVYIKDHLYRQYKKLVLSSVVTQNVSLDFPVIFKLWYLYFSLVKRIRVLNNILDFWKSSKANSGAFLEYFQQFKVFYFVKCFEKSQYNKGFLKNLRGCFLGDFYKLFDFIKQKLVNMLVQEHVQLQINVANLSDFKNISLVYTKDVTSLLFSFRLPVGVESPRFNFYFVFNKKINIYSYFYNIYVHFFRTLVRKFQSGSEYVRLDNNFCFVITKPLTNRNLTLLLRTHFKSLFLKKKIRMVGMLNSLTSKKLKIKLQKLHSIFLGVKCRRFHKKSGFLPDIFSLLGRFKQTVTPSFSNNFVRTNSRLRKFILENSLVRTATLGPRAFKGQSLLIRGLKETLGFSESLVITNWASQFLNRLVLTPKFLRKSREILRFKSISLVHNVRRNLYKIKRFYKVGSVIKSPRFCLVQNLVLKIVSLVSVILSLIKKYCKLIYRFHIFKKLQFFKNIRRFLRLLNAVKYVVSFAGQTNVGRTIKLKKFKLNGEFYRFLDNVFVKRKVTHLANKVDGFFNKIIGLGLFPNLGKPVDTESIRKFKNTFLNFLIDSRNSWFFSMALQGRIKFLGWFLRKFLWVQENQNVVVRKTDEDLIMYSYTIKKLYSFNHFFGVLKQKYADFFVQQKEKYRVLYMQRRFGFNKRRHFWRFKYFFLFLKLFRTKILNKNLVRWNEKRIWWIFWFKFFHAKIISKAHYSTVAEFNIPVFENVSAIILSESNTKFKKRLFLRFQNKLFLLHQLRSMLNELLMRSGSNILQMSFGVKMKTLMRNKLDAKTFALSKTLGSTNVRKFYFQKRFGYLSLKKLFYMYRRIFTLFVSRIYNLQKFDTSRFLVHIPRKNNLSVSKSEKQFIFRILNYNIDSTNLNLFGANNLVQSYYKIKGYFNCIFNLTKLNLKKDLMLDWINLEKFSKDFGLYFKKVYFWNSVVVPFWVRDQFFFFKNYQQIFAKIKYWLGKVMPRILDLRQKTVDAKKLLSYITLKYFKVLKMREHYIWYTWLLKDLSMYVKPVSVQHIKISAYNRVFRLFYLLRDRLLLAGKIGRGGNHISFRNYNSKAFVKTKRSFIRAKSFFIFRRRKVWRKFLNKYRRTFAKAKRTAWFRPVHIKSLRFTRKVYKVLRRRKTRRNNVWWSPFVSKGLLLFDKKRRVGLGIYRYKQKPKSLRMFSKMRKRGRFAVRRYLKWSYRKLGKKFPRTWKNRDLPLRHVKLNYLVHVRKLNYSFASPKIKRGRFSLLYNASTNMKLRKVSKYFFKNKKYSEDLMRKFILFFKTLKGGHTFGFYSKLFRLLTKKSVKKFRDWKRRRQRKIRFFRSNTIASFYSRFRRSFFVTRASQTALLSQRSLSTFRKRLFMPFTRLYSIKKNRLRGRFPRSRRFKKKYKRNFYKYMYGVFRSNKINARFFIDCKIRWFYTYVKRKLATFLFVTFFEKTTQIKFLNLFVAKIKKNFNIFGVQNSDIFKNSFLYFCYFWIKPFEKYFSKRYIKFFKKSKRFNSGKKRNFIKVLKHNHFTKMRRALIFRKKYLVLKLKKFRWFYKKWQFKLHGLRIQLRGFYHSLVSHVLKSELSAHSAPVTRLLKKYFVSKKRIFTFLLLCYMLVFKFFRIPLKYVSMSLTDNKKELFKFLLTFFNNLKFLFISKPRNLVFTKPKRMSFLASNQILLTEKTLLKNLWRLRDLPTTTYLTKTKKSLLTKQQHFSPQSSNVRSNVLSKQDLKLRFSKLFKQEYIIHWLTFCLMRQTKVFLVKILGLSVLKEFQLMFKKHEVAQASRIKTARVFREVKSILQYMSQLILAKQFSKQPGKFITLIVSKINYFCEQKKIRSSWTNFFVSLKKVLYQFFHFYIMLNHSLRGYSFSKLNIINFIMVKKKERRVRFLALKHKKQFGPKSKKYRFSNFLGVLKMFLRKHLYVTSHKKNTFLLQHNAVWKGEVLSRSTLAMKFRRQIKAPYGDRFFKKPGSTKLNLVNQRKLYLYRKKFSTRVLQQQNIKNKLVNSLLASKTGFTSFGVLRRKQTFLKKTLLSNIYVVPGLRQILAKYLIRFSFRFNFMVYAFLRNSGPVTNNVFLIDVSKKQQFFSFYKNIARNKLLAKFGLEQSLYFERYFYPIITYYNGVVTAGFENALANRQNILSNRKLKVADDALRRNYLDILHFLRSFIVSYRRSYSKKTSKSLRVVPDNSDFWFKRNNKIFKIKTNKKQFQILQKLYNNVSKVRSSRKLLKLCNKVWLLRLILTTKRFNAYKRFGLKNFIQTQTRLFGHEVQHLNYGSYKKMAYNYFKTYNVFKTKYYIFTPVIYKMQTLLLHTLDCSKIPTLTRGDYWVATTSRLGLQFQKFLLKRRIRKQVQVDLSLCRDTLMFFQKSCSSLFDIMFFQNLQLIFEANDYKIHYFLKYIVLKNLKYNLGISFQKHTAFSYKWFLLIRRVFNHKAIRGNFSAKKEFYNIILKKNGAMQRNLGALGIKNLELFLLLELLNYQFHFISKRGNCL